MEIDVTGPCLCSFRVLTNQGHFVNAWAALRVGLGLSSTSGSGGLAQYWHMADGEIMSTVLIFPFGRWD